MSPEHITYKTHTFFDPVENNFYIVDTEEKTLHKNGTDTKITLKPYKILLLLIENEGRTVRDEDFFQKVWERKYLIKNKLTVQINKLRQTLNDNERQKIIETRHKNGYRFNLKVETSIKKAAPVIDEKKGEEAAGARRSNEQKASNKDAAAAGKPEDDGAIPQVFGTRKLTVAAAGMLGALIFIGIGWFYRECADNCLVRTMVVAVACVFYGLLAGVGVMLECAYQFDKYGWNAAKMIPTVILLSGGGMFAAFSLADKFLQASYILAVLIGLSFLLIAALLSCAAAYFVIPNIQIAKANFETQPAFAAFYKNIFVYFLPLYTVFVLLIYCLRYGFSQTPNKFAIAVVLTVLWVLFFFFSFITTSLLSDKLLREKAGVKYPYHGFYISLLIFRLVLCFGPTGLSTLLYLLNTDQLPY